MKQANISPAPTQSFEAAATAAARVYRGSEIEAIHYASIAVVNAAGELTHYLGDPDQSFFTRSAIKPFQALPLIMTGEADRLGLTVKQLALTAASHNGTDEHKQEVEALLAKAGAQASDLQCGTHLPMGYKLAGKKAEAGEDLDPTRHNCSGKHAAFLALARSQGVPYQSYLDPQSHSQQLIMQSIAACCEYPAEAMAFGIDGCSAPNYAMPLRQLAIGFKNLALGRADTPQRSAALGRIRDAMIAHPLMVSGERRLDYDLMRAFPGRVVCKVGAEALEAIGFPSTGIGIVVKIHDGSDRALGAVVVETLRQLGITPSDSEAHLLNGHRRPTIRNYRKIVTGQIEAAFTLRSVAGR